MNITIKIISLLIIALAISGNNCTASDLVYGPYEVGFESYKTYDNSRSYVLGEDTISRPLLIHFWYPSQEKNEGHVLNFKHYIDLIAQREDYNRSAEEINNQSFYYVKGYSDFAKSNFGLDTSIHTQELLDSPVYAKSGIPIPESGSKFPLLIYAPSNSKASVQSHMLCEYLASHGFMILSVASAGPTSIQRAYFEESTMAQVTDMEFLLKYCKDSIGINYTKLGLFGFSSGGNAITLFQMKNENVDAVLSLDGGQEYIVCMKLYHMQAFDLEKTNKPYCSVVNNYENYSIYPLYNSIESSEKNLFRMPYLNHNGFISYWQYFDSCSPDSIKSNAIISFDYLSKFTMGFFSKYLKSDPSLYDSKFLNGPENEYIQAADLNYSAITTICNTLLDNAFDSASKQVDDHETVLLEGENQLNILARMAYNKDMAIWLYQKSLKYRPDSWETHYGLAHIYKDKGETLLAKEELLKAEELDPGNTDITDLLNEISKIE